ncbi:WD40 repeat-like protein [Suillus weaverae]|nr:WD40 repeat-like protein [Suillus weaverae]
MSGAGHRKSTFLRRRSGAVTPFCSAPSQNTFEENSDEQGCMNTNGSVAKPEYDQTFEERVWLMNARHFLRVVHDKVLTKGDVNGTCKVPTPPTQEETYQAKLMLRGHKEWVSGVAFIPRTNLLVTSSADKTLRVWDLDTGKQVGEPLLSHDCAVWRVAASPDGRWVASGGWNGSILLWEVATDKTDLKREPVSFKGHEILLRGLVFAPDSETFASASNDLTICVWKRETGQIVLGPLHLGNLPNSVSYSLDGKKLVAGTDKHIIVWSTADGKELLKIQQRAYRVAFTPDGLRLVSGNFTDIRISDATTGDIIKQFDVHSFSSVAIAPSGTIFAIASSDKTTRFFDLTTFEPVGEPLEHPDIVLCVAFSEDGQFIATGCEDKLVRTCPDEKIFKPIPSWVSPYEDFSANICVVRVPSRQKHRRPATSYKMRAVVQRVASASVSVDGKVISSISRGLMVLVGIGNGTNTHPAHPVQIPSQLVLTQDR